MPQTEQVLKIQPDKIEVLYEPDQPVEIADPKKRWQLREKLIRDHAGRSPEILFPRTPEEENLPLKERLVRRYVEKILLKEWGPTKSLAINPASDPAAQYILRRKFLDEPRKEFLDGGKIEIKNDISSLPEWPAARDLLLEAVKDEWRILVFGDFDCDGVCSVTLMLDLLKSLGVHPDKLDWFIPHRMDHGYGVTEQALQVCLRVVDKPIRRRESGTEYQPPRMVKPQLVIVVDCGTNSMHLLNGNLFPQMKGVRALVIDHHHLHHNDGRTDKIPLLNPWAFKEFEHSDLRGMCASGLIYLFGLSLKESLARWNLNRATILAGLASVADVMPMLGTTRSIVKNSIRLAQSNDLKSIPGLFLLHHKLIEAANQELPIDEGTFGFLWGPCLNACGRIDIDCATASVELLTHKRRSHLERLAGFIYDQNCKRINIQHRVLQQAKRQAAAQVEDAEPAKIILATGENWHAGVVGIVAARLRDIHNRPAIVCGWDKKQWRGSGRSLEGFHIGDMVSDALRGEPKLLASGGGHEMACGLKFLEEQRPLFQAWLNDDYCQRKDFSRTQTVLAKAEDFDPLEWYYLKKRLRPYGRKNEEMPIILQHAKLDSASLRLYQRREKASPRSRTDSDSAHPAVGDAGSNAKGGQTPYQIAAGKTNPGHAWTVNEKRRLFDEIRRRTLLGLIVGTFIPEGKPDRRIVATWFNVRRAFREWQVGKSYMLQLGTYASASSGKHSARFTVLNSWDPISPQG